MVFLALLAVIFILVHQYRNDPEVYHEGFKKFFGFEHYGLRSATLLAVPMAGIAYTIMWMTGTNKGGVAIAIPLLIAAIPFAFPLAYVLTGNADKFRTSWALKAFWWAAGAALIINMVGGFQLITFAGKASRSTEINAMYLGAILAIIGIIGTIVTDVRRKHVNSPQGQREITDKNVAAYRASAQPTPQHQVVANVSTTAPDARNFVTPGAPLPYINLSEEELRVPKF